MKFLLKNLLDPVFLSQTPDGAFLTREEVLRRLAADLGRKTGLEPLIGEVDPASGAVVDLLVPHEGICHGILLYYKTAVVPGFAYVTHGAQDQGRCDFVHGIARLEAMIASGFLGAGCACLITNDSLYWRPARDTLASRSFQLTDGTVFAGQPAGGWNNRTPVPPLRGRYPLMWQAASRPALGNAVFKALIVSCGNRKSVEP